MCTWHTAMFNSLLMEGCRELACFRKVTHFRSLFIKSAVAKLVSAAVRALNLLQPGMHDLAWCNEAPVMRHDMVEGRFSHIPARQPPVVPRLEKGQPPVVSRLDGRFKGRVQYMLKETGMLLEFSTCFPCF